MLETWVNDFGEELYPFLLLQVCILFQSLDTFVVSSS
jgi:hypothetical protein